MAIEKLKRRIERYIRRDDTRLAKAFQYVSPLKGSAYRNSRIKRCMDIGISLPLWTITLPVQAVARVGLWIEDRGELYYRDNDRFALNEDGSLRSLPITKLRTMKRDADDLIVSDAIRGTDQDPRLSRVGRILRKLNLDEVPQLWQVVEGKLSFVGLRAARRRDIFEVGRITEHPDFPQWERAYREGRPSLFHPQAALYGEERKGGSDAALRLRSDILYAKNASLGLDMYLMARVILGIRKRRIRSDTTDVSSKEIAVPS